MSKPWKEMTGAEKSAHMAAAKKRKAAAAAVAAGQNSTAEMPPEPVRTVQSDKTDFFAPVELSDDEVVEIRAWALAEAKREQRERKIEAMKAAALAQAREEMGLVAPPKPKDLERARLDELVSVTIDIPEGGAQDGDFIWLDQKSFANGQTYTVTRAVFETIRDICNKQWVQWAQFKGEKSNHYLRMRGRYGQMEGVFVQGYGGGHPTGTRGRGLQPSFPNGLVPEAHKQQQPSGE